MMTHLRAMGNYFLAYLFSFLMICSLSIFFYCTMQGLADICIDPNRAAITELSEASISREVSEYYLNCQPFRTELLPFRELVIDGQQSLEGAQHTLRVINSIASNYYRPEDVDTIVDGLFKELYNVEGYLGEVRRQKFKSNSNKV